MEIKLEVNEMTYKSLERMAEQNRLPLEKMAGTILNASTGALVGIFGTKGESGLLKMASEIQQIEGIDQFQESWDRAKAIAKVDEEDMGIPPWTTGPMIMEAKPRDITKMVKRGPPIIRLNEPAIFKHISTETSEVDEYILKIGEFWFWMALVAPLHGDLRHPNTHFIFARNSTEVGEYLCRMYPEYGRRRMIEVKLAKVHRPGIHLEM